MEPVLDEIPEDGSARRIRIILTVIKVLEIISFCFFIVGILFKIQHWPYARTIQLVSLAAVFIVQVIKINYVSEKFIAIIKALAVLIMWIGCWMGSFGVANSFSVLLIGVLLLISFQFFGNKT